MDKEKKLAVDDNSVFEWGSATKLTVWLSVMQLWEEGKIDLKTDIKEYLPKDFLKHLKYDKPITMLDLMNHQAGFDETPLNTGTGKSLEELLKSQPAQTYEPGTVTSYSNYSTALAGYIVERISGQDFADYVHEHIFQPLGMNHTALLPDLSDNTYVRDKRQGEKTYDTNGSLYLDKLLPADIYPAGQATGTFADFKRFAQALLRKEKLFKRPETWNELYQTTSTFSDKAVAKNAHGFWVTEYEIGSILGHGGHSFAGFSTMISLDFKSGIGMVTMVNQREEATFSFGLPDLVFGKKKQAPNQSQKDFQEGMYRTSRSIQQGPTSISRLTPVYTFYVKDVIKDGHLLLSNYWLWQHRQGRTEVETTYNHLEKLSLWEVVKDYSSVALLGLAVVYAVLVLLLAALGKVYRLLFGKESKRATPRSWKIWHYGTCGLILVSLVNLAGLVIVAVSGKYMPDYRWQAILFAFLALIFLVNAALPIFLRSTFQVSKGRKILTYLTSSASLIVVLNILYWSLYQWWAL
ncbi:beta-lactamase [Streptococcus sanguinis SK678]|nr:beta-lactamase [Streptococcus sanguinis SK678]